MSETNGEVQQGATERYRARGALVLYSKKGGLLGGLLAGKAKNRPVPIRNIGVDGACFLSHERLRKGQQLVMTVRVSDHGPDVLVVGKVKSCEEGRGVYGFQVDVQFLDFKGNAWHVLSHLKDFIVEREESTTTLVRRPVPPTQMEGGGGEEESEKQ